MLIIFGGLPAAGKSTLAKEIAAHLGGTFIRIDTIEQAILNSALNVTVVEDAGYVIGYSVAKDNLMLGRTVVAESVNPIELTRQAWLQIAQDAGCTSVEVEIICSDASEHQRRVESRVADIANLKQPNWQEVVTREYEPWSREHIVIDTANKSIEQSTQELLSLLPSY